MKLFCTYKTETAKRGNLTHKPVITHLKLKKKFSSCMEVKKNKRILITK